MTELLRAELRRLADDAPELQVHTDTWARGRRTRIRDRAVTGLLVASLVALAGALVQVTPATRLATEVLSPRPAEERTALPDHLHAVPERLVRFRENPAGEVSWDPRITSTELAVGPAVAAFTAGSGGTLPVVVTATDGAYHPLALPGYSDAATLNSMGTGDAALSLSPDGRSLAYAWWDPAAPLDEPMPAGIRILDLTAGDVRTLALHGGNGVDVDALAWSPNGEWLAWAGMETLSWTPGSRGGADLTAGRVRVADLVNQPVPGMANEYWGVAVSDSGEVTLWSGQSLVTWDGERTRRHRVPGDRGVSDRGPAAFASADGLVAMTSYNPRSGPLRVAQIASGRVTYRGGVEAGARDAAISAVGWLRDGRLLTLESPPVLDDDATLGAAVVDRVRATRPVPIATVDQGVQNLTVATDLIDPGDPVASYPAPTWPWSTERKLLVGGLVLLAVALAMSLLLHRRRLP